MSEKTYREIANNITNLLEDDLLLLLRQNIQNLNHNERDLQKSLYLIETIIKDARSELELLYPDLQKFH